ncbi:MAG: hypothetical protein J0H01_16880 [Rhizobiales bacterium]|nr:hypothetical protein [Hyphomicrobiales bacterium]
MSAKTRSRTQPYLPPAEIPQADPWLKEGPISPWVAWPILTVLLVLLLMAVWRA